MLQLGLVWPKEMCPGHQFCHCFCRLLNSQPYNVASEKSSKVGYAWISKDDYKQAGTSRLDLVNKELEMV